jgi:hypothetical protein
MHGCIFFFFENTIKHGYTLVNSIGMEPVGFNSLLWSAPKHPCMPTNRGVNNLTMSMTCILTTYRLGLSGIYEHFFLALSFWPLPRFIYPTMITKISLSGTYNLLTNLTNNNIYKMCCFTWKQPYIMTVVTDENLCFCLCNITVSEEQK